MVAAIFAGIFGNLLFSAGWTGLGITLLGGVLVAVFGTSLSALIGQFADQAAVGPFFDNAGGVVSGFILGFSIGSAVLILLGFLISGWILKGGKVRKPWATTFTSILLSALLSVPLIFLWLTIANSTDGLPVGLIIVIGTAVVGILLWLWMTWAHRGYASEFVGVKASASGTATETAAAPVTEKKETPPAPE